MSELVSGRVRRLFTPLVGAVVAAGFLASCDTGTEPEPDVTAPSITITSPSGSTHLTRETTLDASGTASDDEGIAEVTWRYGSASGTASGTESWTITGIQLAEGTDSLVVTAKDGSGNERSARIEVVMDQTAPEVMVEEPTENSEFHTSEGAVSIAGSATDVNGVASITWSTAAGESGTAAGTASWSVEIPLEMGENTITFEGTDEAGNTAETALTVFRYQSAGSLTLDPGVILTTRTSPVRVLLQVDPTLAIEGNPQLAVLGEDGEVVETLAALYDDGNLGLHGDEIQSDGVYSNLVQINQSSPAELRLSAVVTIPGEMAGRSSLEVLSVFAPTTDADDQLQTAVQEAGASKLDEILGSGVAIGDAIDDVVEYIADLDGVASVTAEGDAAIAITYESGLQGGLLLVHTDADGNPITRGGPVSTAPRPLDISERLTALRWGLPADTLVRPTKARIPVSRQTVGTYAGKRISPTAMGFRAASMANTASEDIILNRRVLIYAPYESAWSANEGPELVSMLEGSQLGFDVTYLQNQEATVESLLSLTNFGLVVLATHGAGGTRFATGELASGSAKQKYDAWRQAGHVQVWEKVHINASANGAGSHGNVFVVTDSFIGELSGTFPNAVIVNNSCQSTMTDGLWNAFQAKGAKTYFGYDRNVSGSFAVAMVLELVGAMVGPEFQTTGEAFTPGQADPVSQNAEFEMLGSADMHYSVDFINGGFELGDLTGWNDVGDGRVITMLGPQTPTGGEFMGIVSTGLGYTTTSGYISQSFRVIDESTLTISWNYMSEEFMEYVGSQYQDYFRVVVRDAGGTETVLFQKSVDEIAAEFDLSLVSPEIVFDQGDVYMTGWQTLELDISSYQGQVITLRLEASDVGDSIYDTAILLDDVSIQ